MNAKQLKNIAGVLEEVFESTFALYFKTHSYHWNIESKDFPVIHKMLGEQYDSLWESLDDIAERMRVFQLPAPSALAAQKAKPFGTSRDEMLKDVLKGYESLIEILKKGIDTLEENGDVAGADFLTGLLADHEKTAWMIRASV